MVKSKKLKNESKEEEVDSDSDLISKKAGPIDDQTTKQTTKEKKKGKKKKDDDWEEPVSQTKDDTQETVANEAKEKKNEKKKKKQKKAAVDDDDDEDIDILAATLNKPKKGSKGKKVVLDVDEDDDEIAPVISKKSKGKPKSLFELLDVEEPDEMEVDKDSDEPEIDVIETKKEETKKKAKKESQQEGFDFETAKSKKEEKSGKKGKKKKTEDEDEIDKMLAELELEYTGEKPKKGDADKPVEKAKEEKLDETVAVEAGVDEEKAKKKKKKKAARETEKDEDEQDQVESVEKAAGDETEEGSTVKTAAQKKKEKKERERLKKLAQKTEERLKHEKEPKTAEGSDASAGVQAKPVETAVAMSTEKEVDVLPAKDEKPIVLESTEKTVEPVLLEEVKTAPLAEEVKPEGEGRDEDAGDDGKKSKKDKKKKKEKEEKDKKKPGKRQLLLMQEALKKLKEDEEKRRLEEEEKIRAEEEAEAQRLEELRLAKEQKERKKQKEKEKRDRLKAEGKFLTKHQKQQQARAAATLEALKAQGYEVPAVGEKKDKVARPGMRFRPSKLKQSRSSTEITDDAKGSIEEPTTPNASVDESKLLEDLSAAQELEKPMEESPKEDVKDAWDLSSDSEEEKKAPIKKIEVKIKEDKKKVVEHKKEEDDEDESSGSTGSSQESSDEDDSESESDSEESESDSEEEEQKSTATKIKEKAIERIRKRKEEAEKNRTVDNLRSPIVCVLGHVDTGKTKILDKIRHTHVQDGEAGGITQQIGATMVPVDAIKDQAKAVKNFASIEIKIPGLLIIDTPGHESFSNLRSRGSSLCDIAILVVDIMHGLEPQTIESINLLKQRKTPFIVALNKIDRLYDWKVTKNKDVRDSIKAQNRNTQMEFEQKTKETVVQFAEQGLNAALFYDNEDPRTYVSLVPTSATTGEGMGNLLALVVDLTQNMLSKRLAFSEDLQATVLELKAIPGLGTTIDVILVNGWLREGDTIILAGMDGPVVTQVRSLLMPQPLKELRVKNPYQEYKEVQAAQGVKLCAKDLDKAIAGLNLMVAQHPDEVDIIKEVVSRELHAAMNSIKLAERGVYVQASTLGSLEALLEFLRTSKIPYSGIRIGPVVKKDVMKASIMLEHDSQYAVILAFDVKIERDAQELADNLGVKIFSADIIYHLFDRFIEYREHLKQLKRDEFKHIAVFPCKLRILPQFIFNSRDPIVLGVSVEAGVLKEGTPLCVPTKEFLEIGIVTTIEVNHKTMDSARKGQEVCIKIEPIPGESPKMFGRHFEATDLLVSKVTRQSIDVCKEYFRDDLQKTDWQLMIELKKLFQIL